MLRAWFAAVVAAAIGVGGSARGADGPTPQGMYVVLVGVGQFADPAIPVRPTAEADVRDFYDLFADTKAASVQPDRLVLLTGNPDAKRKSKPATRANLLAAIHEAVVKTKPGDTVVLGFFGRGATSAENTALLTSDTTFADRAKTAVLGKDLDKDLRTIEDRKVVVILDADFTGFKEGGKKVSAPSLEDITKALFNRDEDGEKMPAKNKVLLLSASPLNTPLAKAGRGLFTATALAALRGAADADGYHEGYEADGVVTVDELAKYVEKTAPAQAREVGTTNLEKETNPVLIGEELSHFPLTANPKAMPGVIKRVKALAGMIQSGTLTPEVGEEGMALVTRMPKLKARQELRKKFQQLADGTLAPADFATERKAIKDAMKLPEEEADKYARTVMRAVELARSRYVKDITTGEWTAMAVRGLMYKLDEPVPADVAEELKNAKGLTRTRSAEILREVRSWLGEREDLDGTKDVDTTLSWMFIETHDPYSTYFDHDTVKKMDAPLRGEFRGVGIQIRQDVVRDGLLVVSPIKGSPAYKAGIKAGDLIIGIKRDSNPQGEPLKTDEPREISTKGMKTEKALEIILGKVGVPITIVVQRDGEKEPLEFTIRRGLVAVETVLGVKRDAHDDWTYYVDPENKIGYVCLTQFTPATARDLQAAVEKLKKAGMKGLVLDLRFNPGGLLTQAVDVSDFFIDDGLIVSVKPRVGEPQNWYDRGRGKYLDFPMAVLVNDRSASAAEIVSACLQDYGRAIVVGERTFGKGSVQNVEDFTPTGGQIKMTTARYFPPLGRNIDRLSTKGQPDEEWGVRPDRGYEVKLSDDEKKNLAEYFRDREIIGKKPEAASTSAEAKEPFKDRQLDKAVEYLKGQVKAATAKQSGQRD